MGKVWFFFFSSRRRHTRYWRDWSSDVCSSDLIYPTVGHWIWGGGWLSEFGMQDFAGSTVVHLSGAMAALAGTPLLGPRIGKYDDCGHPQTNPGPNIPLAGPGVIILLVGWWGFHPGSAIGRAGQ